MLFLAMTKWLKRVYFSEYFINTPNFNMVNHGYKYPNSLDPESILSTIDKYGDHTSIKLI